jgi:3-deoxy-D-manno-octulosonate 8-phosphate phosphatase (KDO 8-P phosphatase)
MDNKEKKILLANIQVFVFDFDGVLTDNLVHIDSTGAEFVSCNRSDGLAFDVIKKLKKPAYILSSEKNSVVTARAKKLNVSAIHGVADKVQALIDLSKKEGFDFKKILYVGNDLNDYRVMQLCGYSACPSDSHEKIRSVANIVLNSKGGSGVVRELLEDVLSIDFIEVLYLN